MSDVLNAIVAQINLGDKISFEGLKLVNGQYAIAIQQIASLFQLLPNQVQKTLERILGKKLSLCQIKVKTNREQVEGKKVRSAESALDLETFRKVIRGLDKKNNPLAVIMVDILTGVALEQFFADAFEDNLTANDRQAIANRVMDECRKHHPLFGNSNCNLVANLFDCSRTSGTMKQFWLKYVYFDLTKDEWEKLNTLNPVMSYGCRKQTIHQWLEENAAITYKERFDKLLTFVGVSRSKEEFRSLWIREFKKPDLSLWG